MSHFEIISKNLYTSLPLNLIFSFRWIKFYRSTLDPTLDPIKISTLTHSFLAMCSRCVPENISIFTLVSVRLGMSGLCLMGSAPQLFQGNYSRDSTLLARSFS
jgi:hypothetical protein